MLVFFCVEQRRGLQLLTEQAQVDEEPCTFNCSHMCCYGDCQTGCCQLSGLLHKTHGLTHTLSLPPGSSK